MTITGLKLRDEGEVMVLVDTQGKEQRIPKNEVDESNLSPISPMPSNFAEAIPEKDFHHLLAFLLGESASRHRDLPPCVPDTATIAFTLISMQRTECLSLR